MRMIRKINFFALVLLMAVGMMLVFTACGNELSATKPDAASVDISSLLGADFDEVQPMFGDVTESGEGIISYYFYTFDTDLHVEINESNQIMSLHVNYNHADARTRYHFDGIDSTSTYDDVVRRFCEQQDTVRENQDGAMDYGYFAAENEFVYFSVDADNRVIGISFFFAESRQPSAGQEDETAADVESAAAASIDVSMLLGADFDEAQPMFGDVTDSGEGIVSFYFYTFDTDLHVEINESNQIMSLHVNYNHADACTRYHFDGIDGTSTYDDVVRRFGEQQDMVRENQDEAMDYGYFAAENEFVYFSVDADNHVIGISFFFAESRQPSAEQEDVATDAEEGWQTNLGFRFRADISEQSDEYTTVYRADAPATLMAIEVTSADVFLLPQFPDGELGFPWGYPGWEERVHMHINNSPIAVGSVVILDTGVYVGFMQEGMDAHFLIVVD